MSVTPMRTSPKSLRPFLAALAMGALALCSARAEDAAPLKLAVFDVRFFDTSQEPRDQSAEHAVRTEAATDRIRAELASAPGIETLRPRLETCAEATADCLMRQA